MNLPLILHLTGAVVSAGLVGVTIVTLITRRSRRLLPLTRAVAVVGVYQVVTGAVLSYVSGASLLSFCARVGSYLGILGLTEVLLVLAYRRSRSASASRVSHVTTR